MSDFDPIAGPRPIADDSWVAGDGRPDVASSVARPRGRDRLAVVAVVIVLLGTAAAILASRRTGTAANQPAVPTLVSTDPTPPAAVAPAVSRPAGSTGSAGPAGSNASASGPPAGPVTPSRSAPPSPTSAPFAPHTSTVVASSGLCLDDGNNRTTEGNPVKVFSCNGTTAQTWTFGADGTIRVHNMCLHPEPANPSAGALLAIYTCGANAFETWRPGAAGSLVNVDSGLCLTDPTGTGTTDRVSLQACDGGPRQRWT